MPPDVQGRCVFRARKTLVLCGGEIIREVYRQVDPGVRVTRLGLHRFRDVFEKREDLRGKTYYWQTGIVENREHDADSDVLAVRQGYVSITPIHFDMTHYAFVSQLQDWSLKLD